MKVVFIFISVFILNSFNAFSYYEGQLEEPSWVYIGRAKNLIDNGENGKAMSILQNVIKVEPNNADAHYSLANIYYNVGGGKITKGSLASYQLAITHYNETIANVEYLTIPADEIDAYFKLLSIYSITLDDVKFTETNNAIIDLAKNSTNLLMKGRIYFRLASHYNQEGSYNKSIENYRLAYDYKYRQKISLFRISLILRRQRDYVGEKQTLLLADSYDFDYNEPSNIEVEYSIKNRLEHLENIVIPNKFY